MPDGRSPDPLPLYERDFYAWTQDQAARLRDLTGDNRLDIAHLAEEVADLGKSDKRALESHVTEALKHLCKASAVRSDDPVVHWMGKIRPHLRHARKILEQSPSLKGKTDLAALWADALDEANGELRDYGDPTVPETVDCPFDLDRLVARDFDPWQGRAASQHAAAGAAP
jgi:hypothetical protein